MKKFWLDSLITTLFTFGIMFGVYELTQLKMFDAFDPIGKAFGDMEITDIAFSKFRDDKHVMADTNIVIVNIGYLSRGEIGQQIQTLNRLNPKVIALDIIFSCDGGIKDPVNCPQAYDTLNNMIFASAIEEAGERMVMAQKIWQSTALQQQDVAIYDSMEHTDPELLQNAHEGFVNLDTDAEHQEDLKICRRLNPKMEVNGKTELAFSTMIAMLYDSAKAKRYLERNNELEIINYGGNIADWHGASNFSGRYAVLDVDQWADTTTYDPKMIEGKIVILGFLGADLRDTSWDDKFITPLNKNYIGKTRPDMYGVVVHANAVSMILNEDYINETKIWQEVLLAFVICLLNAALFSLINRYMPIWFDAVSVLAQLIQILVFTFIMISLVNWIGFKLNITLALAAIALVGTCFELYHNVFLRVVAKLRAKRALTMEHEEVLTP